MKNSILILLLINLLVYALAFGVARLRHQSVTVYFVFLALQGLLLLLSLTGGGSGNGSGGGNSGGDAMGYIFVFAVQMMATAIVFLIFSVRQFNISIPVQATIIAAIIALWYFFVLTDYKMTIISCFATSESDLTPSNGVMYTAKGKPFTGTSIIQGELETYPSIVTAQGPDGREYTTKQGVRITHYQNGLKEGEEKLYDTNEGFFNNKRSKLHCIIHYHQGLKHGTETEYYIGTLYLHKETPYSQGKIHGIYKEYEYIYENHIGPKNVGKNIGPLILEKEYKYGEQSGVYRTRSTVGEKDEKYGRIDEEYIIENSNIVSGRRKILIRGYDGPYKDFTCWEFYEGGQLIRKETYMFCAFHAEGGPDRTRVPLSSEEFYENGRLTKKNTYKFCYDDAEDGTKGPRNPMSSEEIYENGQLIEEWIYNCRNNKVRQHRKIHNGAMVEIFNRDTGINRLKEFGYTEE